MLLTKDQVNTILNNAPAGSDKKTILDGLIQRGYELEGVDTNAAKAQMQPQTSTQTGEPSLLDNLKSDLNTRVNRTGEILNRTTSNPLEKGAQLFGQGAGLAANAIEQTANQIPGVKQLTGALGAGINWLATSELSPIKHLGDAIGDNKTLQHVVNLYDTDPNFRDNIDALANTIRLGGDVQAVADAAKFTKDVTSKIMNKISSPQASTVINNNLKTAQTEFDNLPKGEPATPSQFVENPSQITIYRGSKNLGAPDGVHFTTDPHWAQQFGDKVIAGTLPQGAKIKVLQPGDFQDLFAKGIPNETAAWKSYFDRGYDAIVGTDSMNSGITDVIVNPKLASNFTQINNVGNAAGLANKLIETNRNDIVLQLKSEGMMSQADKLAKLDLSNINDIGEYQNAVKGIVGTGHVADIAGTLKTVAEKAGNVTKEALAGRDAKLLSIFSGESTDVINKAIAEPTIADLGIKNGDVALRQAVQTGADSSIKARQAFVKAYGDAFKTLVKDNPGKIASRQKILYKFVDDLTAQGVKVKNGALDFSTSKIVANPGEAAKIKSAYEAIQKWSDYSLEGTNQLKQLVGQLTKFPNEAGGSSKSPFLGQFYHYLDQTITSNLPEKSKAAYSTMNQKFSNTIGLYDDMVDAFNSGDPFAKLSQLFGANKDTLRQVVDFYEKTTGNKISPIVAGRTLAQDKNAAFGFLNPRSWIDFFIPPKIQAELVTKYGKVKAGN